MKYREESDRCSKMGLKSFPERLDALKKLEEIRKNPRTPDFPNRAFYCGHCGNYHITKKKKRRYYTSIKHLSNKELSFLYGRTFK